MKKYGRNSNGKIALSQFPTLAMEPFDVAVALRVMIRRASMRDAQPVQGLDEPGRSELQGRIPQRTFPSVAPLPLR
jgi:hypothetical protein